MSESNGDGDGDGRGTPDGGTVRVPVGRGAALSLPPAVTDGEAAAIVAAVGAHLTDLDRAAAAAEDREADDGGWDGRRWAFAGRTGALSGRTARPTDTTPTDPWTAAGRSNRL